MSVDRFVDAARAIGCTVVRTPDAEAARAAVRQAVGDATALVDSLSLGEVGLSAPDDTWAAGAGVSEAFAASAESGTVVLVHEAGSPRGTAVLPEHHVIVVPERRIMATFQEMVDAVAALDPVPSGVQFVSGASRSGDIESAMVRGMHGPRRVTVVVFG